MPRSHLFSAVPLITILGLPFADASAKDLSLWVDVKSEEAQVDAVNEQWYKMRSDADDYRLALAPHFDHQFAIYPIFADDISSAELKTLIASAEAGDLGYDAIQYAARHLPSKRPTEMSLNEILDWVEATPGQHHAIGRYQIIPPTLRDLIRRAGIDPNARFSPVMQDDLADILLSDAGYDSFIAGNISRPQFMNNLARIWAGLPTSTGYSAYHGVAGNVATISWPDYEQRMAAIFR